MELKLRKEGHEIFIPDGAAVLGAIARTTHLGVAAHPDDLEIMAYHGILKCFLSDTDDFFGVIATDGAGSPRAGFYKRYSDEEMKAVRKKEQKKAALVGEYAGVAFLNYTSAEVKDPKNLGPRDDLENLLVLARPRVVYTHNPADKHDTHVATALRTIQALRGIPAELRPEKVYGCEGYDMATIGRRRAHATYYATHDVDVATSMIFAMDLTALVTDPSLDIKEFVCRYINRFAADVRNRIDKLL